MMDVHEAAEMFAVKHQWREPDPSDIKIKLNTMLWGDARPTVTLAEMEEATSAAFDALWPLMSSPPPEKTIAQKRGYCRKCGATGDCECEPRG